MTAAPTPEADDGGAGRARGRASKRNRGTDGAVTGEGGLGSEAGAGVGGDGAGAVSAPVIKPTVAALETLVEKANHILVQMPEVRTCCGVRCACATVAHGLVLKKP